jgi:hypothetical protein
VIPGELRPGDLVRVRPADEILSTLDETGAFEGVPFMPEMTLYMGRTLTVYKRLEKICDYFGEESRSRRMTGAVLLQESRCDGRAHGGCQAECRIFWKEAWLEHAAPSLEQPSTEDRLDELLSLLERNTKRVDPESHEARYRCQATEAARATTPIPEKAIGQYIREVRVRNVSPWELVRVGAGAVLRKLRRRFGLLGELPVEVAGESRIDREKLNLRPGELVQVRSPDEIGQTLDARGAHRGLLFTLEMVPHCGKTYRVRQRVERLIDERSGKLLEMKNDCVSLEGVVCSGRYTSGAWFCAREHLPLWREAWLKRLPLSEREASSRE